MNSKNKLDFEDNKYIDEALCLDCLESIKINFKDYKININDFKNNHIRNDISFLEYKNIKKETKYKIICNKCLNKIDINQLKLYKCFTCNSIRSELCMIQHDKTHNIIDYKN